MLELRGPEHYKDFNLYVTGGKTVYCDGKSEVRDDHEDEAGLSCETVFLPVNAKTKLTVKVSGFADKTVEFTSAASVKDYYDTAYKRLKSGAEPNNYINISLTKGKGTADSSVTARPWISTSRSLSGMRFIPLSPRISRAERSALSMVER